MKNIFILIITLFVITNCKNKETQTDNHGHDHTESDASQKNDKHEDEDIVITQEQFDVNKMQFGALSKQNFPEVVKTTGMIDVPPQSKQIITSFYGGFVKKSNLLIGDKVRKGQSIVSIENPVFVDMQQEYLEIKEQLTYLKSEYDRQKTLFDEKITSEKKYLKAESEYKRKKAKYNALAKKLKMINIKPSSVSIDNIVSTITLYSSINGTVTKVNVSKGTPISPTDEILEIINTDHIHIELTVFEKYAMKIKKDQVIRFKIPEASDENFVAEVHLVGKTIDEKTRTVKVHGHLHNETKNVFDIGMFVEAKIEISNKEIIALPEEAVIEEGEHQIVLKLGHQANNRFLFVPIEVKIGKKYNGFVEVISDKIKMTDKVLVKGAYSLVGEGAAHVH